MKINGHFFNYLDKELSENILCGGRRSGKTFSICQKLTLKALKGKIVSVASMTNEQARLGAYSDTKQIIESDSPIAKRCTIMSSPREIRFKKGKIFFKSYKNSETAKGIACDILYINEANLFTKQQYIDLTANVREQIYIDYNPNVKFWVDDYFKPEQIHKSSWINNPFLTKLQLEYFNKLKENALKENATSADVYFYKVYYLGEYSEIDGEIFNQVNIRKIDKLPENLYNFTIFSDPSALRGSDNFASVLTATDGEFIYIIDTYSRNDCSRKDILNKINSWRLNYDVKNYFIETNGIIGIDAWTWFNNRGVPFQYWNSTGDKFQRILANYYAITNICYFLDTEENNNYLQQVYEFSKKCKHDDNIDAVVSSVIFHKNNIEY